MSFLPNLMSLSHQQFSIRRCCYPNSHLRSMSQRFHLKQHSNPNALYKDSAEFTSIAQAFSIPSTLQAALLPIRLSTCSVSYSFLSHIFSDGSGKNFLPVPFFICSYLILFTRRVIIFTPYSNTNSHSSRYIHAARTTREIVAILACRRDNQNISRASESNRDTSGRYGTACSRCLSSVGSFSVSPKAIIDSLFHVKSTKVPVVVFTRNGVLQSNKPI